LATAPGPSDALMYEAHIKPLFREHDRQSMHFMFDLWSYRDVKLHADRILIRLQAGSMPCDGPWPADQVELFHRWIQGGKKP